MPSKDVIAVRGLCVLGTEIRIEIGKEIGTKKEIEVG